VDRLRLAVIKLKQVEHVRNERKALAAVIDHPFITNLIASFSDEKSLYMVVWMNLEHDLKLSNANGVLSWIIVLEARSSPTYDANDALAKRLRDSTRPRSQ
jgi:hypothetical protein